MMNLRVRDYRAADREEVARLWHDAWLASGHATATDPTLDRYRERLATEETAWCIRLACAGDEIVGFLAFQPAESWLRQLFVAPSLTRNGIGTRLLGEARRLMPGGFHLNTDAGNRQARSFYEASSLRFERETPHPRWGHPIAVYRWP